MLLTGGPRPRILGLGGWISYPFLDGSFDQDERGAVSRMCAELGLDDKAFLPAA
jgi:hypothetical protein